MWIEQHDNEERVREKKEKKELQKSLDFFEAKKLKAETSNLLQNLAQQIADDFWIDIAEIKNLISSSTLWNLDELKAWISHSENINLEDFKSAINSAKSKIENLSKQKIDSLKKSLDEEFYNPDSHEYKTSKNILPQKILQKAYNPQNFWDQLIGAWVGIFDSSEAVILFIYGLWKWILLTPYHIYLIISWRAESPYKNM